MIQVKCDICGKEDLHINSIVLFRKKLDYCNSPKCIKKALNVRKILEREVEAQNKILIAVLKRKENELLKKI